MPFQNLILRAMQPDEAQKLHDTYEVWKDPFVLPRPASELAAGARKGLVMVVEDPSTNEFVAATGVFDLRTDEYVESGATFVVDGLRGYGLQMLFFEVRSSVIALMYGPEIKFTTAVNPTNPASLTNTKKAGFKSMEHIAEQVGDACKACPKLVAIEAPRICCCDFYILEHDDARALARNLLKRVSAHGKTVLTRHGQSPIDLEVRMRIVTDADQRAALQEFADGKTW